MTLAAVRIPTMGRTRRTSERSDCFRSCVPTNSTSGSSGGSYTFISWPFSEYWTPATAMSSSSSSFSR